MKIGFYNPALDSLSGGERYMLTLASHWAKHHDVWVFWNDDTILEKAEKRLNIDLSEVKITQNIFLEKNILRKVILTRQYDLVFVVTDGSIPTTFARRNLLHFQIPFSHLQTLPWKLGRYNTMVCNSYFTKNNLDRKIGNDAIVIYPPVAPIIGKATRENIILSVGRFSSYFQTKKQEVLIASFQKAQNQGTLNGWKLVLAGGLLPSDSAHFHKLVKQAQGLSIELIPNITYEKLTDYYKKSRLYWHASGFGETDPSLMEHFGITTVEAMSAGCVPISYDGGGQPEIISHGKNGMLWNTADELIAYSLDVVNDTGQYKKMQQEAIVRAKAFRPEIFCAAFDRILSEIMS